MNDDQHKKAASALSTAPCSLLGFRWSVAIDDQPPFACYADKVDSPNAIRYRTLDGETYGWRNPSHLRPLVDKTDWRDLQAAIKSHKLEMARKFISENTEIEQSEERK